jgi:excinuclease ABC subunit C
MSHSPRDGKSQPRLFTADPFEGFGPSRFRPADDSVTGRRVRGKRQARLRRLVREHAPKLPGVYGMLDDRGRLVYVGKAKNLRFRLLSYFRVNSRDPKAGKILDHTRFLLWEQTADEFAALLRELELIQRFAPRFNVLGRPGMQRYHYLCLGKSPAPYAYLATRPTGKEVGAYGPLVSRARSEDAARRINDWFRLRDCPQTVPLVFSDQAELFPVDRAARCLRYEIGTCAGPCAAACSRKEYGAGVRAAKAFLDGRDGTVLRQVRARMEEAAAAFQFEKATAMRDRLAALEGLDNRLTLLRQARSKHSFVYPLTGPDGGERWYLIHRGEVRAVVRAPRDADERSRIASVIAATFTETAGPLSLTDGQVDSVLLVAAWFRKHPEEKAKLMTRTDALTRCGAGSSERGA